MNLRYVWFYKQFHFYSRKPDFYRSRCILINSHKRVLEVDFHIQVEFVENPWEMYLYLHRKVRSLKNWRSSSNIFSLFFKLASKSIIIVFIKSFSINRKIDLVFGRAEITHRTHSTLWTIFRNFIFGFYLWMKKITIFV